MDALPHRPASVIARCAFVTQKTFAGMFYGAASPGHFDHEGVLRTGHAGTDAGWPAAWHELRDLELITFRIVEKQNTARIIRVTKLRALNAHASLHWTITAKGWEVRMDDIAWLTEWKIATQQDAQDAQEAS